MMTDWTRRSFEVEGLEHNNPIPMASRIGPYLHTSGINGKDRETGLLAEDIDAQCAQMFRNVRIVLDEAGATPEQILKMSFYLPRRDLRPFINKYWLEMFPDPLSRPARHVHSEPELTGGMLVQCEFFAIVPVA
jgi:enamine deaminase RidA (YjgF/YER057c/UK114 family)